MNGGEEEKEEKFIKYGPMLLKEPGKVVNKRIFCMFLTRNRFVVFEGIISVDRRRRCILRNTKRSS